MFLAITSAEDVPITQPEEVVRASERTFLQDYYFRQLERAAEIIPRGKVSAEYREPVKSDIPTLLISGFIDPATPPRGAEEVARHLKNSRHVVVRYGSHASDDCAMQGRPQWRCARRFTRSVPSV
jgi:pimeloyl-ACP methyl ester carboxylesterase